MSNTNEAAKKAIDKVENKTSEVASASQSKVGEVISEGSERIQKAAETAQNFVNDKAQQVNTIAHQAYDRASETAGKLGTRATDAYTTSAEYVRNIDVEKARESVKTAVKEKPELSIAIAALTGLVIGLLIGRSGNDRN